jgi:hypothetical protein
MPSVSKQVVYFTPERGAEEELGGFDSLGEASAMMHEHHEGLYQSGEEMQRLYPAGKVMGKTGDNFVAAGKGTYRIAERQIKL